MIGTVVELKRAIQWLRANNIEIQARDEIAFEIQGTPICYGWSRLAPLCLHAVRGGLHDVYDVAPWIVLEMAELAKKLGAVSK